MSAHVEHYIAVVLAENPDGIREEDLLGFAMEAASVDVKDFAQQQRFKKSIAAAKKKKLCVVNEKGRCFLGEIGFENKNKPDWQMSIDDSLNILRNRRPLPTINAPIEKSYILKQLCTHLGSIGVKQASLNHLKEIYEFLDKYADIMHDENQ